MSANTAIEQSAANIIRSLGLLHKPANPAPQRLVSVPARRTYQRRRKSAVSDSVLRKRILNLPKYLGQPDMRSVIETIREVGGVRIRANVEPELRAKIERELANRKTVRDISESLGVSKPLVYSIRKEIRAGNSVAA